MYYMRVCVFLFLLIPYFASAASLNPTVNTEKEELRFGVISLNHPLVMYRQYLPFTDFLTERLPVKVDLVLAKDYENIVQSLLADEIHIALLAGVSYVEVTGSGHVVPICSVLAANGTPTTSSVFVVRDDRDDIHSVQDLKGKSFAFGSPGSASSYLQPLGYLYANGITPADFSTFNNLSTQDAVARSVLRGIHDGGSISRGTLARFSEVGLKEIAQTEPYPGFVIVASERVSKTNRDAIRELLLTLDYTDAEVSQSAARWSPLLQHGFSPTPEGAYDSVRILMDALRQAEVY